MTSKLQVTIPKVIATQYGITPGSEVEWLPAGDAIRMVPQVDGPAAVDPARRVTLFDAATARQLGRQAGAAARRPPAHRGWTRDELYERGSAR